MEEISTEKQTDPSEEDLKKIIEQIVSFAGFRFSLNVFSDPKNSNLKIFSINSDDDLSLLIGKNGQNLKALEQLVKLVALKKAPGHVNFSLDINDYRQSRADFILQQARTLAERVRDSKKAEAMSPMTSYERRLVHVELASYPDVETESIGEEPKRRVVVKPLVL